MVLTRRNFLALTTASFGAFVSGCAGGAGRLKPSRSAAAFEQFIADRGLVIAQLSVPQLVETTLAFYREVRAAGLASDPGADMLLFQWGVFNWGQGENFEFDITRQFISSGGFGDDAISQFRCTAYFSPTPALRTIPVSNRWCRSPAEVESFGAFIRESAAFRAVSSLTPMCIQLHRGKV